VQVDADGGFVVLANGAFFAADNACKIAEVVYLAKYYRSIRRLQVLPIRRQCNGRNGL